MSSAWLRYSFKCYHFAQFIDESFRVATPRTRRLHLERNENVILFYQRLVFDCFPPCFFLSCFTRLFRTQPDVTRCQSVCKSHPKSIIIVCPQFHGINAIPSTRFSTFLTKPTGTKLDGTCAVDNVLFIISFNSTSLENLPALFLQLSPCISFESTKPPQTHV